MKMKKVISIAIVFGMLAVSFAMVTPTAKAEFIEVLAGAPWGGTFTPKDVAFSDDGHYAVMVGQEEVAGSNVWGLNVLTDTWFPIGGAPIAQTMTSVAYDPWSNIFVMCGDSGGSSTVYFVSQGANMLNSLGHSVAANAIAVDGVSNILVGGYMTMYSYNWASWSPYTLGTSFTVNSITFNPIDQRFYIAAYNSGLSKGELFFSDPAPLNATSTITHATIPFSPTNLLGISWNPMHNYGLAVGNGVYKVNPTVGGVIPMTQINPHSPFVSFYDVAWDIDGYNEAAIFGQNTTMTQAVYYRYYHSNPTLILGYQDPAIALYACGGIKPPGSPKFVFVPAAGGGIIADIQAFDQSTRLTANAVFPKLYWIGFNDTALNSRMDQQVTVDSDYLFTLQANYSEGWTNCQVEVWAWHDLGLTGAGGSAYPPAPGDADRNLAFRITFFANNGTAWIWFPNPLLEVTTGIPTDIDWLAHPTDAAQDHHRVQIPVWFGNQIRSADGNGFLSGDVAYDDDLTLALQDTNSWDFNITVRDRFNPTAVNTSYGEFGIQQAVSVFVTGNPSGNAPPGTLNNLMTTNSNIVYSSNAEYWVNVSIPDLLRNGVGPNNIAATEVSVQNIHIDAAGFSDIAGPLTPIVGANTPMYVWGAAGDVGINPANNGLVSAGPVMTDYTNPLVAYTELTWWVSVPGATPEGIYWAVITVSIEN